ncbi:MAG: TolC family protein [Pseudomonadota bacterium]
MPKVWMRLASLILSIAFCALPASVYAQTALTEEAAIQRALQQEGVAERDDADLRAASAETDIIGPLANPDFEVGYEGGSESEWQVRVVQPIDLYGVRSARRDAARADAVAAGGDIERRRHLLVAEVRASFVRCAAGFGQLAIWERYVERLEEAERVSTERASAGDAAGYDVRRVRVQLSAARAERLRTRGERDANCALLSALTGVPDPQVPLEAITDLDTATQIRERPDLVAQQRRVDAARYRVSAARRARLPQLALGAGARRVDDGFSTDYGPVISVGISLPIWNGGGAAVRRQEAFRASLEADLAIATRQIAAEQNAARSRALSAREAATAAMQTRDDASRLGTIADTAYQSGEVSVVELLDAYEAERDADLLVISLALDAALAATQYDLAIGRTY